MEGVVVYMIFLEMGAGSLSTGKIERGKGFLLEKWRLV